MFSLPRMGSERNSEIFCSAEQPEFRRKKPFVPSIPSSAVLFLCRKFPTLGDDFTATVGVSVDAGLVPLLMLVHGWRFPAAAGIPANADVPANAGVPSDAGVPICFS
jgi:hypothetical protein